jgi:hypothetical protein
MVMSLSILLLAKPASACKMTVDLNLDDIKYASVVVIGRIVEYEIVLDQAVRKERKEKSFLSDYAHFTVLVDEVLAGQPPRIISVTWDNSTFGEPETMEEGPYLIGLREPDSQMPPLRGPSATVLPSPEPESLTVLQAPCAPPFILGTSSAEAKTIRDMLAREAIK